MNMKDTTGVILAGGLSRRLDYKNKALLKIGGKSVIQRIINALSEVMANILLITNSPDEFKHLEIPMFGDIIQGAGSLGGIYTGLKVSETYHNLIVACDMPFIRPSLLALLVQQSKDYDVVIPVTPDGHHPTCAIYSKDCIKPIEAQIRSGNLKISDFFPNVRLRKIDFNTLHDRYDQIMFFNINTKEDYLEAISIAESHQEL
jgi:molybdopterin-guanine dinucleotide biosynthesis protein A